MDEVELFYNEILKIIQECCENQEYASAATKKMIKQDSNDLTLEEKDKSKRIGIFGFEKYLKKFSYGEVQLFYHSYDRSRTFKDRPDGNEYHLKCIIKGKVVAEKTIGFFDKA